MFKKFSVILILAIALGAFLFLRPYLFQRLDQPRLVDRLPDADFIGRAYVLDVARETSGMMYYHKIPFRDLFSHEFILGQAKLYGLNLQVPVYFFANENGAWGAMVQVSDSSKVSEGIERLRKFTDIKDTTLFDHKVFHFEDEKGYLSYSHNYMLLYKGNDFNTILKRIVKAKYKDQTKTWKAFLRENQFKDEKLVIYSNWSKLKENGIETAIFAHDSDSISFSLLAYMRKKKPLNVKMKSDGLNLPEGNFTQNNLNIHLDISRLREDTEDPIYKWLVKLGQKISFPTKEFLNAWEGDLSLRQGGFQVVQETYIESELDEDFNVTEVEKTKDVKVPGFSILFSVNENGPRLIKRLLEKGVLTKDEQNYRFLFSPPLKMKTTGNYFIFHSGQFPPKTERHANNNGAWTNKGTKVEFSLDSLGRREAFGTIYIPVDRIIRRNRFF